MTLATKPHIPNRWRVFFAVRFQLTMLCAFNAAYFVCVLRFYLIAKILIFMKIEIAIPIVIWKKSGDPDRHRDMRIADLFSDPFTY